LKQREKERERERERKREREINWNWNQILKINDKYLTDFYLIFYCNG